MQKGWSFSVGVLVAGLALWLAVAWRLPYSWPGWAPVAVLVATGLYGEVRSLYVAGYGALNFGEGLYFGLTLRYGPLTGAALTALIGLAADSVQGKRAAVRIFNLGWSLIVFTLVGLAAPQGELLQPRLLLAWAAYALAAGLLQAVAQTYYEDLPLKRTLRHQLQGLKLGAPAVLCLGLMCYLFLELAPWSALLTVLPIEIFSAYVRIRDLHAELARAHQELVAAQGQLAANARQAALGVMAAGVAHEINNPLGAMAASLFILRKATLRPPEAAGLELIEKGIARCQGITQRMLLYARPSGSCEARAEPAAVVADALLFLGGRVKARVQVEGLEGLPPVAMEAGELVQVITNLLTNASDANPQGTVRLWGQLEDRLVLRVADQGGGIEASLREKIFEPFFTTKSVGHGTGLGLSIAQSLARSAGGELELESSGPEGSVFCLSMPRAAR